MKMILRTHCESEDMSWRVSFFHSKGISQTCGSRSFSSEYYFSITVSSAKSLSFGIRAYSVKSMFEGLGAKVSWMEKMT